jgi:hypothetical protein
MENAKNALSVGVNHDRSFARRYFTSAVSLTALVSFILALVAAWISTGADDWWKPYLQNLSTTFVGIAATVWIINFLLERQANRLSAQLRAPSEQAAMHLVRHFIKRVPLWLPAVSAPDSIHRHQLEWIQNHLDRLRTLCDVISPGPSDAELQDAVTGFRLRQLAWSESMETLDDLIRMTAPAGDRASAFDALKERTNHLIESARALDDTLSNRHPQAGAILGLKDE